MKKKRIAVVTGASSGMGREFVLQIPKYCKSLDEIWVIARRAERLEKLAKESSVKIVYGYFVCNFGICRTVYYRKRRSRRI